MNDFEEELHRTWVQLLVDYKFKLAASIAIDSDIILLSRWDDNGGNQEIYGVAIDIPTSFYSTVKNSDQIKNLMERAVKTVCRGRLYNDVEQLVFEYRIKLVHVENGWKSIVKGLIAGVEDPNQGLITEMVRARDRRSALIYNEMKFASDTEIRIAQELERRTVLFFPLPLAVRAETGDNYQDHREVDFLICQDGVWGILEVSYHPDRFEKDSEKDSWFKKSGILCIQHYSAERCYNHTNAVVEEFLEILVKHKR